MATRTPTYFSRCGLNKNDVSEIASVISDMIEDKVQSVKIIVDGHPSNNNYKINQLLEAIERFQDELSYLQD